MRRFINSIDTLLGTIFTRIIKNCWVPSEEVALLRILTGGLILLIHPPRWQWIAQAPGGFFNPPILSLLNLASGFPSETCLLLAEVLAITSYLFISLGFFARYFSGFAGLLLLLFSNYSYSFGKIDHNIMLIIFLLVMAFTNAGCRFALRKDLPVSLRVHNTSLAFLGICIAFGMFSAGFGKALHWIDFDLSTSGFLSWYYPNYYLFEQRYLLAPFADRLPVVLIEFGEYLVVFLEISGFIWLIKSSCHWRVWLYFLCLFHLMNHLFLNIPFTGHLVIFGVFLIPPYLIHVCRNTAASVSIVSILKGIVVMIVIYRLSETLLKITFFSSEVMVIYRDLFLWIGMLLSSCYIFRKRLVAERTYSKHSL